MCYKCFLLYHTFHLELFSLNFVYSLIIYDVRVIFVCSNGYKLIHLIFVDRFCNLDSRSNKKRCFYYILYIFVFIYPRRFSIWWFNLCYRLLLWNFWYLIWTHCWYFMLIYNFGSVRGSIHCCIDLIWNIICFHKCHHKYFRIPKSSYIGFSGKQIIIIGKVFIDQIFHQQKGHIFQ